MRHRVIATLGVAVFLVLAGTGAGNALWSSTASTSATTAAGAIGISQTGFADLATVYTSANLTDTAMITVTNSGTVTAPFTMTVGAPATALAIGAVVRTWGTAGNCASMPGGASTSNWTAIPSLTGTLAPAASAIFCIRTSVIAGQLVSLGATGVVGSMTLTSTLGSWTASTSATATQTVPDTTPPSAPVAAASETSGYSTRVTWAASTDNVGVVAYEVLRGGVVIATVTTLDYLDTSLAANTAYSYTVRAKDAAGLTSPSSAAVPVTTLAVTSTTWYQARNGNAGNNMCLDAEGASGAAGTLLIIWGCKTGTATDTWNQDWQFRPVGNGDYYIVPRHAQTMAIEIPAAGIASNGTLARLAVYTATTNRQWTISRIGTTATFQIINASSNRCLAVVGGSTAAGAQLEQRTCATGTTGNLAAQTFTLATS